MAKHSFLPTICALTYGASTTRTNLSVGHRTSTAWLDLISSDIVDIKPANMEDLVEVITAAEFHPINCNTFIYSSSKGTIRMNDMRMNALCDKHAKGNEGAVVCVCLHLTHCVSF